MAQRQITSAEFEGWQDVQEPPLTVPATQAPPAAFAGASPYFAASIPLSSQLVPDIMPTRFPGGLGAYRIMPPIPAGVPGINAAVKSVIIQQAALAPAPSIQFGGVVLLNANATSTGPADIGKLLSFKYQRFA